MKDILTISSQIQFMLFLCVTFLYKYAIAHFVKYYSHIFDNLKVQVNYPLPSSPCPPLDKRKQIETLVLSVIFYSPSNLIIDFTLCHKPSFRLNTYKYVVCVCCISVYLHIFLDTNFKQSNFHDSQEYCAIVRKYIGQFLAK